MKVVKNKDGSVTVITETILTNEEVTTLKIVAKQGWWEFRDYGHKDLCRGGILKASVCDKLYALGYLDNGDGMDWHTTFHITELGTKIVSELN